MVAYNGKRAVLLVETTGTKGNGVRFPDSTRCCIFHLKDVTITTDRKLGRCDNPE